MIATVLAELGAWNWMALGFILLALEILVPGVFLLWIGIAAIVTGAISLGLWQAAFWTWHVQVLVFLVLSLISAWAGKRFMLSREAESDEPLLNRRADQLVGRVATLHEPIVDGYGRVRLDDTVWRVTGPELETGTKVRVTGISHGVLEVSPAA